MKLLITIFIFTLLSFLLSGCTNNTSTPQSSEINNISFSRTSTNIQNEIKEEKQLTEIEMSNFSTPLKSGVPARITNIKLTSNKLNGYILKKGETFSFNQLVGPCTAEEGYQKAEIFVNKKIKFAYGGGNCQVSTTLYNAALAVPRYYYYRKT